MRLPRFLIRAEDALESFWFGDGRLFEAWLRQQEKLYRLPLWRVLDYLMLALRNTKENIRYGARLSFPNFNNFEDILWTLRWAIAQLWEDE